MTETNEANWSVPETAVLDSARDILDGDRRGVLATVIAVDGSAYRRPGAKMVVPENGDPLGHVTAGCLEDEVQRLASEVLAVGEPRVVTYDLTPEADDDVWGLGVGCNGVIDILLEPIDGGYRPVLDAVDADRAIGVLTVVDGPDEVVGARAYYDPETASFDRDAAFPAGIIERLEGTVARLVEAGKSDSVEVDDVLEVGDGREATDGHEFDDEFDGVTVFVDGIAALADLVVVGSGNDVGPVAELGAKAGFRVRVVGFRGADARPERFPMADDVRSTSPARIRDAGRFDADTYVVVATHNFVDDQIAIGELLETDAAYIGLMGPRERFDEILEELHGEGRTLSDADRERLYTPVGLDLGGGSPHQIALSIVAEVLAVKNDREPRHLRNRDGPIHDRVNEPVEPDPS